MELQEFIKLQSESIYRVSLKALQTNIRLMVVYVGKSNNIRTRLQKYRKGDSKALQLFPLLVQEFTVYCRWCLMDKEDIRDVELELLNKYDYL
jgi:hypothetical protein